MNTIAKEKVIGKGSKLCHGCGIVKDYADYYVRATYGTPEKPAVMDGHFVTECKDCMRQRGNTQKRLPPWESQVKSEQLAIDYLMSKGIWATTGKMTNAPDVDIAIWGAIWCEVKHACFNNKGSRNAFTFVTSDSQQERGFLGHIVMLICEYPDGRLTYHFFNASDPVFYRNDGRLKSGIVYRPGQMFPSRKGRGYKYQLTQSVMETAEDNTGLIIEWLTKLRRLLASGKKPEYGKVFKPE
jgi:hypothetical protein